MTVSLAHMAALALPPNVPESSAAVAAYAYTVQRLFPFVEQWPPALPFDAYYRLLHDDAPPDNIGDFWKKLRPDDIECFFFTDGGSAAFFVRSVQQSLPLIANWPRGLAPHFAYEVFKHYWCSRPISHGPYLSKIMRMLRTESVWQHNGQNEVETWFTRSGGAFIFMSANHRKAWLRAVAFIETLQQNQPQGPPAAHGGLQQRLEGLRMLARLAQTSFELHGVYVSARQQDLDAALAAYRRIVF